MVIKHYKHLTLLVPLVHPQVVDVLNIAEDRWAIAGPGFGLRKDGSGRHQVLGPCGFQR
jgi:hypothetical protein